MFKIFCNLSTAMIPDPSANTIFNVRFTFHQNHSFVSSVTPSKTKDLSRFFENWHIACGLISIRRILTVQKSNSNRVVVTITHFKNISSISTKY